MNPGLSALAIVVAPPPNRPNTGPTGLGWVSTDCNGGGNGGSVLAAPRSVTAATSAVAYLVTTSCLVVGSCLVAGS
jgi:hypothetical protein